MAKNAGATVGVIHAWIGTARMEEVQGEGLDVPASERGTKSWLEHSPKGKRRN